MAGNSLVLSWKLIKQIAQNIVLWLFLTDGALYHIFLTEGDYLLLIPQ